MAKLLDAVITAHGGLDRWSAVRSVNVTFNFSGGLLDLKGFPGHHRPTASVDVKQPRVVLQRLGGDPDDRWIFTRDRVWIERRDGWSVEERSDPRAAFAGHVRETPWDRLHLTYFLGYALWNYLTAPFLFAWPGFNSQELDPHVEGRETWRVLEVTYPDNIPAHTKTQKLYFDDAFMLNMNGCARRGGRALLLRSGNGRRNCLSDIAPRGSANIGRPAFVRPHVVRARLHERGGPDMRWAIDDRSVPMTTPFGAVAVRIDGDPEGSPLLLCQRFRGTMNAQCISSGRRKSNG